MSWELTIDRTTLPTALLPLAKSHMRIDWTEDDAYLTTFTLPSAIDLAEQKWGLRIFGATAEGQPTVTGAALLCPIQPVSDFTVTRTSDSADISSEFELRHAALTSPWVLAYKGGTAWPSGVEVSLVGGYAGIAEVPPAALSGILRIASTLYEFRESVDISSLAQIPGWLDDLLVGLWVPRA